MARSPPGSSTTPAFPRKEPTRSAWRANTAANWANRITARSPCRCPWPMMRAACRLPSIFTCRRSGSGSPCHGGGPEDPRFSDQAADRAGADPTRAGRGPAGGRRPGRCRLWRRFRTALTALSLSYVLGVQSTLGVWPPGCGPLPPKPGKGRRPKLQRRDAEHQPVSAKDLALTLPPSAWQTVDWRAGSRGDLSGRFAALRVRPSHRDYCRAEPHPEEWLLIEWPGGGTEPSQYWLSTLPASTALVDLVHRAKLRWRIERDYQDLKQELGLDHYEGRGWRGFHHHATLCLAAYGFLVSERSLFPPQEPFRRPAPALPPGPRASRCGRNAITRRRSPRCAAACLGPQPAALPMLSTATLQRRSVPVASKKFMTQ